MFPILQYHQIPALHEKIKHGLPAVSPLIWHVLKEAFPVLFKQASDPVFWVRELLENSRGYQK